MSSRMSNALRGTSLVFALAFCMTLAAAALLPAIQVYAAGQFTPRKLTMSSQAAGTISTDANGTAYAAGDGGNGAKATHTFNFTQATSGATLGSVLLEYCTTPFFGTTCTAPTNMNASNITNAGTAVSGFSGTQPTVDTTTAGNAGGIFAANAGAEACTGAGAVKRDNCILLTRTPAVNTLTPAMQIIAGNGVTGTSYVVNPTAVGTFYVRVTTFSDAAYTNIIDQGVVSGSINGTIDITSKVQEKLNFSVGNLTSLTAPTATCNALTSGNTAVALGDTNGVLDIATAYFAKSYWRINTNAANGTLIQYSGDTLKTANGTNSIAAIGATAAASTVGTPQFGLTTDSGDTAGGNGYTLSTLNTFGQYGSASAYAFSTASKSAPVTLVSQGTPGPIPCETGAMKYVGNIGTVTKAGVYKTSIAYIAVPTF